MNYVLSWVDQNCLLRISDLIEKVFVNFSIRVSASTIQRVLDGFHYSMKSILAVPERRNDERTLNLMEEYALKFRNLESEQEHKNFVFVDEMRFTVVSRPKRRRSRQGTSPYVTVNAAKSRNIFVVAAMNKYRMIYHKILDKAVTG